MADPWMPPFPALRAFHAAARLGRFRDAARELGVTESAVSHQVRRLEAFLHIPLFERNGPRVSLTAQGARYLEDIDPAIIRIQEATRALLGPKERARVALTLPPSLAILWLIPNLADFERACPEIDLQLVTTTRLADLRREQIDLAIRHGRGPWTDVESEFLLSEATMPVCKPGYLPEGLEALPENARLIVNGYFPDEWEEWARAHGLAIPPLDRALRLESQEQVLEAAENGLGLAIGRSPLVDGRFKSGKLVAPFGTPDLSGAGYHLCTAKGGESTAAAKRVARWLKDYSTAIRPS